MRSEWLTALTGKQMSRAYANVTTESTYAHISCWFFSVLFRYAWQKQTIKMPQNCEREKFGKVMREERVRRKNATRKMFQICFHASANLYLILLLKWMEATSNNNNDDGACESCSSAVCCIMLSYCCTIENFGWAVEVPNLEMLLTCTNTHLIHAENLLIFLQPIKF